MGLIGSTGPFAGKTIEVDRELIVGRVDADVTIDDAELSRRHAKLLPVEGGIVIQDLGSSNGTFVNGKRIEQAVFVPSGQEIELGASKFTVDAPVAALNPTVARPVARAERAQPAREPAAAPPPPPEPISAFPPPGSTGLSPSKNRHSHGWLILAVVVAVVGVGLAIYAFATRNNTSKAANVNQAFVAAQGNAAFQRIEVSPAIDKLNTACVPADNGKAGPGHFRFITSACENATSTVATFPLHRGTSGGKTVYYVITDDSSQAGAKTLGVNYVPKLANARGSSAVQKVTYNKDGTVNFPATVNFHETHVLVAGPTGFPPSQFSPSALGAPNYSPLIELPNGTVMNAPQIANDTGQAIKVVKLNTANMTVQYVETEGRYEGKHVHYASFDSTSPLAASIENMTYAPGLAGVPKQGHEGTNDSARETLSAFVNGATGADQPLRQGINSAIVDRLDPHNILHEVPILPGHPDVGDDHYAPMWDVHLIQWTPFAVAAGDRTEVRSINEVMDRLSGGATACGQGTQQCSQGLIQGIGGKVLTPNNFVLDGATGFVVNCPLISIDLP
jgi:hypothetical protein